MADTCGVHNLHGMPGLFGGIVAIVVVPEAAKAQVIGIVFTIGLALLGGLITGNIVKLTGSKIKLYEDSDEFTEA
jgi:ammonium transporter Rh